MKVFIIIGVIASFFAIFTVLKGPSAFKDWTPHEYQLMDKYGVKPETEVRKAIRILLKELEDCHANRG